MNKTLVTYFSPTGTTKRAAEALAQAIGADLFEIEPTRPYSRADLNWNDRSSRSSIEMRDEAARPAIVRTAEDIAAYDVVFVGFPIWWYVEPRIVDTFLETHDLAGKTIVPFATSGGSGLGKAPQRMQTLVPKATVADGKLLNGRLGDDALRAWARDLGL